MTEEPDKEEGVWGADSLLQSIFLSPDNTSKRKAEGWTQRDALSRHPSLSPL